MHIEVLVEDSSGAALIESLMPQAIGPQGDPHSWRIHPYKGVGRIPQGLVAKGDPSKRALLDQLPRLLIGYGKTPGIDAVVVVLDSDNRPCKDFLSELQVLLKRCNPAPNTLFRLAIEEMEAWILGDRTALLAAYPKARKDVLSGMSKTAFAAPGNCWRMQFIMADTPVSKKRAGLCPGNLSMSGSERSAQAWTSKETLLQALGSSATDCAG